MTDDQTPDDETCPLCGQPFHHKRVACSPNGKCSEYRRDARVCKHSRVGRADMHYVHLSELIEP